MLGLRDTSELQIADTDQQIIALKGFIFNDFLLNPGCVFRRTVLADQCSVQCPALQHLRVESERVEQSGSQGENIFWVSSQLGGGGGV